MASELTPLLSQFPYSCQGEDLEATGVGEYWFLPAIESMESSGSPEHLQSRPEIEMVCVAEDYLRLYFIP